jgi:L-asparaginase/Glu-tRNA(Gln) amidotransferase subunit D
MGMKKIVLIGSLVFAYTCVVAQNTAATRISLNIKPYKNQWVYLAYYYGGIKALADSAFLNAEGKGIITAEKPLAQGIYLLALQKYFV